MKTYLALLPLLAPLSAGAAVAPYYDRVNQLQAVLDSPALAKALVGQEITGVTETFTVRNPLTFQVTTATCSTSVTLDAHSPGRPGMTTYSVRRVAIPTCLGN